jgi:hypothetical protein
MKGVRFYLVNSGNDFVMDDQVYQPVGLKVAYTNCPYFAFFIKLLHCPPLAINITKWLMDEVKVQVIQLQFF